MTKGKKIKVSQDTQIHMSTTYTRNKQGKESTPKRAFNFVIKGLLISTVLVGSVVTSGTGFANTNDTSNVTGIDQNTSIQDLYSDEAAMITNLKMANKMLNAAILKGELTPSTYDNMMKKITAIEHKLALDNEFHSVEDLAPVLEASESILQTNIQTDNKDILSKREGSIKALERVQASLGLTPQEYVATTAAVASVSKVNFNDYKAGQYWSEDMLWAVSNKYVQGYTNALHPTDKRIKTKGNWLNPHGQLTESQMTAVILRYAKPDELAKTKGDTSWWAAPAYKLAEKYHLPVKASAKDRTHADDVTTRGTIAQAIAAIHFGKPVSLKDSINFMYDSGISYGYSDKNGKAILTQDSYGAKDPLKRAHIVSFIKRYDDFKVNGKVDVAPAKPASKPVTIAPSTGNVVDGVKVRYGQHTYGSNNQSEYNTVMTAVDKAIKTDRDYTWDVSKVGDKYFEEYLDGARPTRDRSDPNVRSERNSYLIVADGKLKPLLDAGLSPKAIRAMNNASIAGTMLLSNTRDPGNGSPRSAYDAIAKGLADCDPIAQVYSAVYDAQGYNTAILARPGHAIAVVQVEGKWVDVTGGGFSVVDPAKLVAQGNKVLAQPTKGGSFK